MELTGKDRRLVAVVTRLREDLGAGYFDVVDHWDGDQLAVGLAKPGSPEVLVYVAVAAEGEELFFECEVPAGDFYDVIERQERADYDEVRGAVARHLRPDTRQDPPEALDRP